MHRGRRTSYTRDNRGRFASSPGGGGPKRSTPATRRAAMRAGNRLNRDNAGRISGIGRNGATVRGGRLKTAGGNRRATQIASMRPAGFRSGTIAKGGRGVRGSVARSLAAVRAVGGRKAAGLSRARPGQQQRAMQRAQANEKRLQGPAMRGTGLRTRAGVGYAVAKGAQSYYSGSMPRRKAAFSPLTGSMDKKALAARRKQVVDNNKPQKGGAAKQQPQRPSKKPTNKAQRAYLAARSNARDRNRDLQGADAGSRRMANSAAAVLRNMERRRSAAVPKAPADSPRARQQQRQLARSQRAGRNELVAWAREADGPGSKASRSATVARRAQQIYAGKVDPKTKTKSRLTRTSNPEVLRKRIAKIKDNTAKAAAKAAKAAAKKAAAKRIKVATPQATYRSLGKKSAAASKEAAKYPYTAQPYNPKNFFGGSKVRDANIAKASPEKVAEYRRLQKEYATWMRNRNKTGKAAVKKSNAAWASRGAANKSRPGTILRSRSAAKPKPAATRQARMASGRSRVGKALSPDNILLRRDKAEAQRVAANGGRRTSRTAAIRRRTYNSITTAVRARYAMDNPGKQRRYSTVKNPGPDSVSGLTLKAPRLTAKASQPSPQTRAKRPAGTVRKPRGMKPGVLAARRGVKAKGARPPKPTAMKVNLFQQASREASSKAGRGNARASRREDTAARIVNSRIGGNTPAGGIRKAERSLQIAQAAYAYRNEGFIPSSRKGRKGYRAPRTRLY